MSKIKTSDITKNLIVFKYIGLKHLGIFRLNNNSSYSSNIAGQHRTDMLIGPASTTLSNQI